MRMNRRTIQLSLLSAVLLSLIAVISTAFADTKHVTFDEPTTVGNTVLKPGIYRVEWTGSESEVTVRFIRENKTVVTVSARLVVEKSPRRSIGTLTLDDNSRVLKRLSFTSKSLVFDRVSNPPGESLSEDKPPNR
jgi:hypothetical protein